MTSKSDRRRWAMALLLATALPIPAVAAPPPREDVAAVAGAPRIDIAAVARLYRQAVLGDGVDALFRRVDALIASDPAPRMRARVLLMRAALRWQGGAADEAIADVDRALALVPDVDGMLLKARLLDARGDAAQAATLYGRVAAETSDATERASLNLRLALIAAGTDPASLVAYAGRQGPAPRAHMAEVVGLLGDPKNALALDTGDAGGTLPFVQEIRRAGWAIAAQDPGASDHGWRAAGLAREVDDRRYALALTVEALRDRGRLADALALFDSRLGDPELQQAKVDVLLELRRYDEAIAIVRRAADPELRRRLLGIFDMAGRTGDAEAEYRRLIAAEPQQAEWYGSLAALRLGQGDEAGALAVYRQLFAANRGRIDTLVRAARQMVAVGLGEPATRMMTDLAGDPALAAPARFFLFETWLDAGRNADAEAELARVRAATPAGSAAMADVADAYERLGRQDVAFVILQGMEAGGRDGGYDGQVHLAELALAIGRPDESLARWRRLRAATTLPARAGYLDNQIVRVARQMNRLDAIAGEIEARLATGSTGDGDLDLLIRIRLDQNRRADAEAAIERYATRSGVGEIARLARLRTVYARLGAGAKYRQALHRLVAIDPAHAETYRRELVSDAVRDPDMTASPAARATAIDRLLADLNAAPGADRAGAQAFAAGVYAAASLDDRAIDAYRRALAADPANGDKLLQLVSLLKQHGRIGQAAATAQYAVESAPDEDALIGAVEALTDVYDDGTGAAAQSATPARRWARRIVIERIATAGGSIRLYDLVADLSLALADFDMQLRAIDASLPLARGQRASMLRQLVTLASGGDTGPAIGDDRIKSIYGRRLIALRNEFPPSVYADIAGSLLARRDVPGAERALSMMTDIGGLTNVEQLRGEAYLREGYAQEALSAFGRALVRDQDNLALLVGTSILRERQGQSAVAHRWYWRGLRGLLQRQPQDGVVGQGAAGQDVQRYYDTLVEGLLATWPQDAGRQAAIGEDLTRMAAEAMPTSASAATVPFARRGRLMLIVDTIQRIAAFRGDAAMLAGVESLVGPRYGEDPAYRRQMLYYRDLTGGRAAAAAAEPGGGWAMRGLRAQAADTDRPDLTLALAIAADDRVAIAALVTQAIAGDGAARASTTPDGRSAWLYDVVLATLGGLPADAFAATVLTPLDRAPTRDALLFDLFRTLPDRLDRIERIAGRRLLDDDALVATIVAHGDDPPPPSRLAYAGGQGTPSLLDAIGRRLDVDARLSLYVALVERMLATGAEAGWQGALGESLLKGPLTAAQQERLVAAMSRALATPRGGGAAARSAAMAVPRLLMLDTAPANRPALVRVARAVAERFPDGRQLPALMEAYFAGDRARAFALLDAVRSDTEATYDGGNYTIEIVERYFVAERHAAIAAFVARDGQTAAEIDRFYRRLVLPEINGSYPRSAELAGSYRKLLTLDPGNRAYFAGLLDVYWKQAAYGPFADLLARHVAADPADRDAATMLQLAYAVAGQPDRAQAVARSSGVDFNDAGWLVAVGNRAGASAPTGLEPTMGSVFRQVLDTYQARNPDVPVVVAMTRRRQAARNPTAGAPGLSLAALRTAPADTAAGILRGIWRGTPATPGEHGRPSLRQLLLRTFPDPSSGAAAPSTTTAPAGPLGPDQTLLPAMTTNPAVTDEIDTFLSVMEPEPRQAEQGLYDLMARGLVVQRRAQPQREALLASLAGGTIGDHGLQRITAIANAMDVPLDPGQLQALSARLQRMPALSAPWRVALARVFATGGDFAAAADLLTTATMQFLYPTVADMARGTDAARSIAGIVADLGRWRDVAAARRTHAALVRLIEGQKAGSAEAAGGLAVPPLAGGSGA